MASSEGALLQAHNLGRAYGRVRAVTDVSLELRAGEVLLLLGPNGAGKSTLLRLLAGLLAPQQGTVRVAGRQLTPHEPDGRRPIGLLSHQSFLYDDLTLEENLLLAARLYRLPAARDRVRNAIERVGLSDRLGDRPRSLSRGMLQRAAIARALLHDPAVLLLDEPFTGLDSQAAERFRLLLRDQGLAARAVVLVTHHPVEAWELATRIGVLVRGRLAADGPRPADPAAFDRAYQDLARG